jgi:hypothetical protein
VRLTPIKLGFGGIKVGYGRSVAPDSIHQAGEKRKDTVGWVGWVGIKRAKCSGAWCFSVWCRKHQASLRDAVNGRLIKKLKTEPLLRFHCPTER